MTRLWGNQPSHDGWYNQPSGRSGHPYLDIQGKRLAFCISSLPDVTDITEYSASQFVADLIFTTRPEVGDIDVRIL